MSKSITQKMKYKQSVIKYSYKHGVKKASIQFNEWPKTIYRWRKRYDGNIESLRDKSRRPPLSSKSTYRQRNKDDKGL